MIRLLNYLLLMSICQCAYAQHQQGACVDATRSTVFASTCVNYTLNNKTYDSSGTYTQLLTNYLGCDSIITIYLTINRRFTDQSIAICEGEKFFAGSQYRDVPGVYVDTLLSSIGCDSVVTTRLSVNVRPRLDLGPDHEWCTNTRVVLSPGSFRQYHWQDERTDSEVTVTAAGTYWVRVSNEFNCSTTDTLVITRANEPPANFLKQYDSICSYGYLKLEPINGYSEYAWSTGGRNHNVIVQVPGEYALQVRDAHGCVGSDTVQVVPKDCVTSVFIPTSFTPNGDGRNDVFRAQLYGGVRSFRLQVFDRGGQVVFQTSKPDGEWNGSNHGTTYTTGSFVWQCAYELADGQKGYQKGVLTLIR